VSAVTTTAPRRISPADVTETELARVRIPHVCPGHRCGATPGQLHVPGCDQAACWACGEDRNDCTQHYNVDLPSVWLGVDPLDAIAARLGWWIHDPELGVVPDVVQVRIAHHDQWQVRDITTGRRGHLAWDRDLQGYVVKPRG
jgi:hypothetical protein